MACKLETFLPELLPFVSSPDERFHRPPDNVLVYYIRQAAIELITRTHILTDTFCADAQCGVCTLPLIVPEGRTVLKIQKITIPDEMCEDRRIKYNGFFEYNGGDLITLNETPMYDAPRGFCITYSYLPDFDVCEVPDELCDPRYQRIVRELTLSSVLNMANMDWAAPALAQQHQRTAATLLANIRSNNAKRGGRSRPRISRQIGDMFWDT